MPHIFGYKYGGEADISIRHEQKNCQIAGLFQDLCGISNMGADHNLSRDALDAALAVYAAICLSPGEQLPKADPSDRWVPLERTRARLIPPTPHRTSYHSPPVTSSATTPPVKYR